MLAVILWAALGTVPSATIPALFSATTPDTLRQSPPRTRVICGMPVISPDPTIDPGIVMTVPRDTQFAIHALKPRICAGQAPCPNVR